MEGTEDAKIENVGIVDRGWFRTGVIRTHGEPRFVAALIVSVINAFKDGAESVLILGSGPGQLGLSLQLGVEISGLAIADTTGTETKIYSFDIEEYKE